MSVFSDAKGTDKYGSEVIEIARETLKQMSKAEVIEILLTTVSPVDIVEYAQDDDGNWYDYEDLDKSGDINEVDGAK